MKVEILQENLLKGLQTIQRVVSSKPQMPILSNVLLKTVEGQLQLCATNLETTLTTNVGAKVLIEGAFTLPIKTFLEIVSALPAGKVSLELIEGQMDIKSEGFKSKINGIPASEWPVIDKDTSQKQIILETSILKDLVSKVNFSVGFDENRPALTGVLTKLSPKELMLVATDGFRLSLIKSCKLKTEISDLSVIIPAKVLTEICRWEDKGSLKINISQSQVEFVSDQTTLSARLINANFPPYEKIIPSTTDFEIEFMADDLLKAVKLAAVFARDNANIIKLKISDNKCIVSAAATQVGENEGEIEIVNKKPSESEFVVAFNYHYLTDLLSNCSGKQVVYRYTTALSPGLFTLTGQDEFLHLIMPVRVQN